MAKIIPLFSDTLGTTKSSCDHQFTHPFLGLYKLYSESAIITSKEKGFYQAKVIPLVVNVISTKHKIQEVTKVIKLFPSIENISEKLV